VVSDRRLAEELLGKAYADISAAERAGIPQATAGPLRTKIVAALDRLYEMSDVTSTVLFAFPEDRGSDLKRIVRGPDGAPFVLDEGTKTVYRINVANEKAQVVYREGRDAAGATEGAPRLLAVGGRDLLVIDKRNVLWRWKPANSQGAGTTIRPRISGATEWGDDVLAAGTFLRDPEANLYNLYIVDVSDQQVKRYSPAQDGSGFPVRPTNWLTAPRDVSGVTSIYIDGDIWLTDRGAVLRFANGNSEGWEADAPEDDVLRPAPTYQLVRSAAPARTGTIYAFDAANGRLVALSKVNGAFLGQYRLADGSDAWSDLRDFYVEASVEGQPEAIVWISRNAVHRAILASPANPSESPAPSGGASSEQPRDDAQSDEG